MTEWTHFWDMHSGGGLKEPPYHHIYIEAPMEEAEVVFYKRFGHNPNRVSCACCGEDYSIDSHKDLAQLTGFHRNCRCLDTPRDPETGLYKNDDPVFKEHYYLEEGEEPPEGYNVSDRHIYGEYQTLEQYLQSAEVLVIRASEILPEEREGEVPEQGFVWKD